MTTKQKSKETPVGKRPPATTETAPTVPQLDLQDIQLVERIINLASTRGAFKANELTQVGQVYDKLGVFLRHFIKPVEENKEEK